MNFHVLYSQVVTIVEMSADTFVRVVDFDITKVVYEAIFQSKHGLTNILFFASCACYAVDKV